MHHFWHHGMHIFNSYRGFSQCTICSTFTMVLAILWGSFDPCMYRSYRKQCSQILTVIKFKFQSINIQPRRLLPSAHRVCIFHGMFRRQNPWLSMGLPNNTILVFSSFGIHNLSMDRNLKTDTTVCPKQPRGTNA